jgi:hypothetical protein
MKRKYKFVVICRSPVFIFLYVLPDNDPVRLETCYFTVGTKISLV